MYGAWITIAGAVLTIALNMILIPKYHYTGAAWATFICYLFMMVISYVLGQKYYPVPYAKKKLIAYLIVVTLIYGAHELITALFTDRSTLLFQLVYYGSSLLGLAAFAWLILNVERKELVKLPYLGKWLAPKASAT